ncbi:hypothetical protein ACOSP7_003975 [Xanthoceras sorbifolium]
MGRSKKLKKELVAEDWCFVCKDGGSLRICDYRDCLKAYHPECVDKDDSLLDSNDRWTCNWHCCCVCNKVPKFYCFCCPSAVCRCCFDDSEFALIRKNKGLCDSCLELVWLIEEKKDVDSNGSKVDFHDRDTVEFLFYEYWEIIKEKERLTAEQVISAYNQLKKGSDSSELDEGKEGTSESDDESQLDIPDDDTDRGKLIGKRKRAEDQLAAMKRKAKSMKFNGWGSEPLLEFLASIGTDTSTELSQYAVMDIITEYCRQNKLFDEQKKKKINFDARLHALLGRKSVNRNSLYNLLTPHLAENLDLSEDELEFSSKNIDAANSVPQKRQQGSGSTEKSNTEAEVVNVQKSCFASIVPKNIKLLYLRKSLVEKLSKQLESFEAKVMGAFVRVKSDPNDYLQKNYYMLVQVIGVQKTSTMNSEIMLQVSNMVKEVPIPKLSEDNFSEEECEDLRQRVKNGLLKRPTVVELEQKARSLHEEITKHWISRELILLQNHIDRANEKGWRREYPLMTYLQLLQKPEEQSRLLREVPEVIADELDAEPVLEDATTKGEQAQKDGSSESILGRSTETPCCDLKCHGTSSCNNGATDSAGIQAKDAFNSSSSDSDKRVHVDGTTKELESVVKDPQDCKSTVKYMPKEKKELQSVIKDLNEFNSVVKDVRKDLKQLRREQV